MEPITQHELMTGSRQPVETGYTQGVRGGAIHLPSAKRATRRPPLRSPQTACIIRDTDGRILPDAEPGE